MPQSFRSRIILVLSPIVLLILSGCAHKTVVARCPSSKADEGAQKVPPHDCLKALAGEPHPLKVFKIPPHEGFQRGGLPSFLPKTFKGQVMVLGIGGYGGTVYRLLPELGPPKVVKRNPAADELQQDQNTLEWMGSIAPEPSEDVRIVRSRIDPNDPRNMELENLYGRDLQKVLEGPWLEQREKDLLIAKYLRFLNRVKARCASQYPETAATGRDVPDVEAGQPGFMIDSFDEASGKPKRLFIKPSDILVDSETLELVLIDPH